MSYSIEQLRAWPEAYQRWVFFHSTIKDKTWREFLKLWAQKPRSPWPGVYCIWSDEELLYVGYSKNVSRRINKYNISDFSDFATNGVRTHITKFTALQCESPSIAAAIEAQLIHLHRPPHNHRTEPKGGQVRSGPRTH